MQDNAELEALLATITREQLLELALKGLLSQQAGAQTQINRITIDDLCDKHIHNAEARELTKNRIKNIKGAHKYFKEYCAEKGIIYADQVTDDHGEEYYTYLKKRHGRKKDGTLAKTSIIHIYTITKTLMELGAKRHHIHRNPFEHKPLPLSQVREWWTWEYTEKLLKAIDKYAQAGVRLKYRTVSLIIRTTGLRVGLLYQVKLADVKIAEDGKVFLNTKCKVPRSSALQRITTELLNERTKKTFLKYLKQREALGIKDDGYVFADGSPDNSVHTYRKALKIVCEKAELPYIKPHGAKHGFITEMAEAGFTAEQICALTGNRTPQLIQKVYMHLSTDKVREKARAILNKGQ